MNSKIPLTNVLFYLSWTIVFTIIPLVVVRPEKLTPGIIILAVVISAILSIPATKYFLKALNRKAIENLDIHLDLLPEEKIIQKTDGNMKKGIISFAT